MEGQSGRTLTTGWTDIVIMVGRGDALKQSVSTIGPFKAGIGGAYLLGQGKSESSELRA